MTIYAEYLFLENALVGWLLLRLTARLCSFRPVGWRLLTGSALSGLAAFILFLPYQPLWLLALFRAAFPLGLTILVFGREIREAASILKPLMCFYLLSFAAGGIAIACLYLTRVPGVTAGGFFYIGKISYLQVALGCAAAWILLSSFFHFVRERLRRQRTTAWVRIVSGENSVCVKGLMDTGNFLRDPLTGSPVILAEEQVFRALWPKGVPPARFRLIPFRTVGEKQGFLKGALPEDIFLQVDPPQKLKKGIVVALCDPDFSLGKEGDCSLILHPDMWEGEITCHV